MTAQALGPFLSPVGMRPVPHCSGCDKPSPGRSRFAVLAEWRRKDRLFPRRQREERVRRHSVQALGPSGHRTSVTLDPKLSQAVCVATHSCSGAGKPTPVGAGLQSWQSMKKAPLSGSFFYAGLLYLPGQREERLPRHWARPDTGPATFRLSWTKERSPRSADTAPGKPG